MLEVIFSLKTKDFLFYFYSTCVKVTADIHRSQEQPEIRGQDHPKEPYGDFQRNCNLEMCPTCVMAVLKWLLSTRWLHSTSATAFVPCQTHTVNWSQSGLSQHITPNPGPES